MSEVLGEIRIGEEQFEVTRDNLTLYRHLGKHAVYDHLFVTLGENSGAYLWSGHTQFDELAERAVTAQARLILNLPEPSEADVKNFMRHALSDLEDTVPEGWE